MVGSEHSIDVPVNSDKAMADDDEQSEALNEFNFDSNIRSPVTSTLYPVNYGTHYYECFIFFYKLQFFSI
jgi:hypothetical protein